ncbi:hypothetical protein N7490_006802 [Penicillium lividum]|nr:hypothetical protein N7490_006802 [Penicillium lividum]
MVGIRKVSRSAKHEDFRRRLERALSLSPSDSDSAQGSSLSADCDTTEIESLKEHNFPSLQRETTLREDVGREQKIREESTTSDNRFMIAFQYISESIQSSLSTLTDKTKTIYSDLDDIVQRLVAVEAAIDTLATETQSTTEEDN